MAAMPAANPSMLSSRLIALVIPINQKIVIAMFTEFERVHERTNNAGDLRASKKHNLPGNAEGGTAESEAGQPPIGCAILTVDFPTVRDEAFDQISAGHFDNQLRFAKFHQATCAAENRQAPRSLKYQVCGVAYLRSLLRKLHRRAQIRSQNPSG